MHWRRSGYVPKLPTTCSVQPAAARCSWMVMVMCTQGGFKETKRERGCQQCAPQDKWWPDASDTKPRGRTGRDGVLHEEPNLRQVRVADAGLRGA